MLRSLITLTAIVIVGCGTREVAKGDASLPDDTGADTSSLLFQDADSPKMHPDGAVQCGYVDWWCDPLTQWCHVDGVGAPSPSGPATCEPLPQPCTTLRTCACLLDASSAPCIGCERLDSGLLLAGCWEP
jgi:hypothetical protein